MRVVVAANLPDVKLLHRRERARGPIPSGGIVGLGGTRLRDIVYYPSYYTAGTVTYQTKW